VGDTIVSTAKFKGDPTMLGQHIQNATFNKIDSLLELNLMVRFQVDRKRLAMNTSQIRIRIMKYEIPVPSCNCDRSVMFFGFDYDEWMSGSFRIAIASRLN